MAPPAAAQAMADKIKGARVKVLDQCGHWPMLEKPADCARLLADFVRNQNR